VTENGEAIFAEIKSVKLKCTLMKEKILIIKPAKSWYALRTAEQSEKKVAGNLLRKHIETFLPVMKVNGKHWDGNSFTLYAPVFPSIVFAYASELEINVVLHTKGVINFLFWRDRYAVISREDILAIQDFCSENESIWVEKCDMPNSFQDENDLFIQSDHSSNNEKQVRQIYLNTLGYSLAAFAPVKRQVKFIQKVS
jgi:transcription antitermination factor NusG